MTISAVNGWFGGRRYGNLADSLSGALWGSSPHNELSHHNPGKDVAVALGKGECWSAREG